MNIHLKAEIVSAIMQANKHGLDGREIDGCLITNNRDAGKPNILDFMFIEGMYKTKSATQR